MSRLVLSTVALLALSPAFAFTGHKVEGLGIEPARVLTFDPEVQGRLYSTDGWRAFTEGEGRGWLARFDEKTGTPHRMWGPGLAVDTTSADALVADLVALFDRQPGLHGDADLQLKSAEYIARMDAWYVDFDVFVDGLPVWRGGATARVKHGQLVQLGFDTYPRSLRVGELVIDAAEARQAAVKRGPAPRALHEGDEATLMWLPVEAHGGVQLRMVWEIRTETAKPVGQWVSFVDAETGELVHVYNEVRFATITAEHDTRTVNGETSISPLPYLNVQAPSGSVFSDSHGTLTEFIEAGVGDFSGQWFDVHNATGTNARFDITGDRTITSEDADLAEIDTYVFLHQIRDWGLAVAPEVRLSNQRGFTANVNMDDVCNAYYDGRSVNFFRAGQGCNNTGRIADVVYHEWGHGFHDYSIVSGVFDGSVSEGAADVVAFLQTGDSVIAPYFQGNGSGIREVSRDRVYPDDLTNEVHSDGLIFAGAVWDLWELSEDRYGKEDGTALTTDVFTGLLKGGPTLETVYDEAVFADDDDGDLGNGTPNQCLIIDAFLPHGLGPNGGGLVLPTHEPLATLAPDVANPVVTELVNLAPTCLSGTPTEGTLHFAVDGGAWEQIGARIRGNNVAAELPALPAGSYVEYYLAVDTDDAGRTTLPSGGAINPFVAYVGDVLEVYCNDFEADDGGFTHRLVEGDDVEGADDWQWGVPGGLSGDPAYAYSGEHVWGNDLGTGDFNGAYQANRVNRLTARIDTRHYLGAFLQYQRWLSVEDASFDQGQIYADDALVWTNHGSQAGDEHHEDSQWAPHAVDLGTAGDDGQVAIAWEIRSDGGVEMGGWTLDDVCVYAPDTADNRLGVADFRASELGEGRVIELTWTNPRHAPVEEVRVVRKANSWPTGPDDGRVVFETTEVALGAPMYVEDQVRRGSYHYAVYAFDGTQWLSWTRPNFNADVGVAGAPGGCGCSSTPAPAIGWLGLGLFGFVVRRRRS